MPKINDLELELEVVMKTLADIQTQLRAIKSRKMKPLWIDTDLHVDIDPNHYSSRAAERYKENPCYSPIEDKAALDALKSKERKVYASPSRFFSPKSKKDESPRSPIYSKIL